MVFLLRRSSLYFLLATFAITAFFWNGGYVQTSGVQLILAESIVEDFDIDLTNNMHSSVRHFHGCVKQAGTKAVSKYPLGRTLAVLPVYAPAYWLSRLLPSKTREHWRNAGLTKQFVLKNIATFSNMAATALAALCILAALRTGGAGHTGSVFGGLAYAFGSSMFSFNLSTRIEPVSALFVAAALLAWVEYRKTLIPNRALWALAFCAVSTTMTPQAVLISIFLMALLLLDTVRGPLILAGTGITVAPLALFLWYNNARFGSLLQSGYSAEEMVLGFGAACGAALLLAALYPVVKKPHIRQRVRVWMVPVALLVMLVTALAYPWRVFAYWLSPEGGIALFSFPLLLAMPGFIRNRDRSLTQDFGIIAVLLWAFLFYYDLDKSFILNRYAALVYPFLAYFAGIGATHLSRRTAWLFLTPGMALQLLVTVDNVYNFTHWRLLGFTGFMPPIPQRYFWHLSLLRYKLLRLVDSVHLIPAFVKNPAQFDRTLFFNNYWFVVYWQELPHWLVLSGTLVLAGLTATSLIAYRSALARETDLSAPQS